MKKIESKHLLGLEKISKKDIETIIDVGFTFREVLERPIKKVPVLNGKNIVNLFFENSTRTKISFELAEKRLSADVTNFSASSSSVQKGETLKDTIQNIHVMKMDCVVMRHPVPGSCLQLTNYVDVPIVNAGDGTHEHPTQAILDMMSLHEKFGYLEGLKVGILGDISHSRVALSNIYGLQTMGAEVTLCGPSTLVPPYAEELGVNSSNVDQMRNSNNPEIRRMLGTDGSQGAELGLSNDWAYQIIKQVGNYGEIFERNIGVNTPLGISRGLNALWTKGGLLYSPPFR